MIKPKIGKCIDCQKDAPLTAKRCRNCYWRHRATINSNKPQKQAKNAQRSDLKTYFANQILTMPDLCEESGMKLPKSPLWMRKACIAHILPKRPDYGFPSVATHPQNKVFLHPDIHANMDNLGERYIRKMKCLQVMKDRVKILLPLLTEAEKNRVPEYLID